MRHRAQVLTSLVFATCTLGTLSAATEAQQWTRRMFTEVSHDFGNVKLGETPVHKFKFENPFNETVHIQSINSSCGCTIATASERTLKTYEAGEIICKFNTPAVGAGFKQATVTIRFDQPVLGEMQLTVRGNIVTGVSVNPEQIEFGQVAENDLPVRKIELVSSGNPFFQVKDVKSTFDHIKVQLQEKVRRQDGYVNYEILTQLKDTVPKGFNQGELYLIVQTGQNRDGSPQLREVPVKFNAKVVSALQLSPEVLSLGPLAPGEEISKKVFLKADLPFRIIDVRCHSEAFRVKADPEAKKMHIVTVTYQGNELPGRHECELSFQVEYTDETGETALGDEGTLKAIVDVAAKDTDQ